MHYEAKASCQRFCNAVDDVLDVLQATPLYCIMILFNKLSEIYSTSNCIHILYLM